jgi:hypothetical protein
MTHLETLLMLYLSFTASPPSYGHMCNLNTNTLKAKNDTNLHDLHMYITSGDLLNIKPPITFLILFESLVINRHDLPVCYA